MVAKRAAGGNHRRAFFHSAVIQRVDRQAVPVNNLRSATLVHHINRDRYAFAHAKDRTRDLVVVGNRIDHDARRDLKLAWPNAKRIVRTRFLCRPPASPRWTRAGDYLVPQHDGS